MHRWLSHFQLYCWLIIVAVAAAWLVYVNHLIIFFILAVVIATVSQQKWPYLFVFGISFLSAYLQISAYQAKWASALTPIKNMEITAVGFSHKNQWGYTTQVKDLHSNLRYILNTQLAVDNYSVCSFEAKPKEFKTRHNTNQADFRQYFYSKQIVATLNVKSIKCHGNSKLRVKIKHYWLSKIEGKYTKSIVSALIFGDKSVFDRQDKETLLNSQVMHLFVISGAHIAFLMVLLVWVLRVAAFFPFKQHYVAVSIFIALVCLFYAYLSGFGIPILRAMIALLFWLFIRRFYNVSAWSMLLGLVAFMLVFEPLYLLNVSFILSFTMVAVMLVQSPVLGERNRLYLWSFLFIKLWLVSCLLSIFFSMPINTMGVINNVMMSWVVSFILLPISIFSLLLMPWCSSQIEWLFAWLFEQLQWLSSYHFYSETISFYLVLFLIIVLSVFTSLSRWHYVSIMGVCLLFYFPKTEWRQTFEDKDGINIVSFDVGQGQATLIQTPDLWLLYDMGFADDTNYHNPKIITQYLNKQTPFRPMVWVVSHSDNDHSGGFEYLLQHSSVKPEYILMGQVEKLSLHQSIMESCHGKSWRFKQTYIHVAPLNPAFKQDNDQSCVVNIEYKQHSVLLTGDISKKREYDLLDQSWFKPVDVLQLAHHGSNTSSSEAFLKHVTPKLVINNSGFNNRFNHPSKQVIDKLNKYHYPWLDTATCGASEVYLNAEGIHNQCMKLYDYPWQKKRTRVKSIP